MSRKTTNSSAASPETGAKPQEDASTKVIADASNPSGENGPDGTNTASESGDAAGKASAEPVKPLGEEPAKGIVPEAATPSMPGITPEVEASASGILSEDASQGEGLGGAGAAAGITGGFSRAQADAIVSHILGVSASIERREFMALGAVRHNNVKVKAGGDIVLSQAEHARLFAKGLVVAWELGDD